MNLIKKKFLINSFNLNQLDYTRFSISNFLNIFSGSPSFFPLSLSLLYYSETAFK